MSKFLLPPDIKLRYKKKTFGGQVGLFPPDASKSQTSLTQNTNYFSQAKLEEFSLYGNSTICSYHSCFNIRFEAHFDAEMLACHYFLRQHHRHRGHHDINALFLTERTKDTRLLCLVDKCGVLWFQI